MNNNVVNSIKSIIGSKNISELDPLYKIQGTEEILIDNGEFTMKTTVDTMLGYIAKQINSGTIPDTVFSSCNIIEMPEGEYIPITSRKDGNFYLRECDSTQAQFNAGLPSSITVSPNMGLRIVED